MIVNIGGNRVTIQVYSSGLSRATEQAQFADLLAALQAGSLVAPSLGVIWAHNYAASDGDGAMWRRALAAGIALNKPVHGLPGSYVLDGTPSSAEGLLGFSTAVNVSIVCETGEITFTAPTGNARALLHLSGGANFHCHNVVWDGTNVSTNFAIKCEGAGDFSFGNMEVIYKGFRFVGTNGSINGVELKLTECQGHGFTGGSATGEAFGYLTGGYIDRILGTNVVGSDMNWSAVKVREHLRIGTIMGRWTKWKADGTGAAYPTRYAAVRLGNGLSNVTIGYVYAEGKFRGVRLTDTDNCWVDHEDFRNLIGPAYLFNRKDQRARNSGVLKVTGVGANRGNMRNDVGVSDKDNELIPGEGDVGGVIQEGEGWTLGQVTISSDENQPGSGVVTASTGSATVTNFDDDYVGQDYNCFKDVVVGDLLFTTAGVVLGTVAAIAARRYFSDASATVVIGTSRTGTMTVALGATAVTGSGTDFSGTMAVGDWIYDANGSKVGKIASFASGAAGATSLTLVSGALVPMAAAAFRSGGLPAASGSATQSLTLTSNSAATVSGVAYEQRTPDDYFYCANVGNITITGAAIANDSLAAGAGTITCSISSTTVTGVGTGFSEALIGQSLFRTDNTVIGQIAAVDSSTVLSLTANAEVDLPPGSSYKRGRDFTKQFTPGDLIFNSSKVYAGVVATVPDPLSATLAAPALTPIVASPYLYGKLYKTRVGLEVAFSATNTNVNLDDVLILGVSQRQHFVHEPEGIKPTIAQTIFKSQLARIDPTVSIGVRFYVSNLTTPGWVYSDGANWVIERPAGMTSNSSVDDITVVYIDSPYKNRLNGVIATDKSVTLSDTGLPNGATYEFAYQSSGVGSRLIKDSGGSTLVTLRPGQACKVTYEKSVPVWRVDWVAAARDSAAQITTGVNAPSNVPRRGDLYTRNAGGPGTSLYVAEGTSGTSSDWTPMTSALDAVYAESYGVVPGNPSNLVAFNTALDAANAAGKALILPAGTLTFPDASPVFNILDDTRIIGAGRGRTKLYFTGLDSTTDVFNVSAKSRVYIADLTLEASTLRTSGNLAFAFFDCVDCTVYRCGQTNFTQGFVFARSAGSVPPTTTNLRNKAIECVSLISRSYGFFMDFATACEFINCEAYGSTAFDGFKTGGSSIFCKMIGCHSEGNADDGFDTYDGFISSVMSNCTAYDNGLHGFQVKGTAGGTHSAVSYVDRESVVSNCVAQGNTLYGFVFQETRQLSLSGLIAVENGESGFLYNNAQQIASTGLLAIRNTKHGYDLQGATSRCSWTGCAAVDNSYVDGTTQNATYDGWNLNTCTNSMFTGCRSGNGTEAGRLGGQRYGYDTTTSAGNIFTGCSALSNVTGSVTGTTPYVSNVFSGFSDAGTWIGWKTSATVGAMDYERASVNAQLNITRTSGATVYAQAQASLGLMGTSSAHPFSIAVSGTRWWEWTTSGHYVPTANNNNDIGSSTIGVRTLYLGTSVRVSNVKVIGAQGAAVADATDAASAITQLNALLARCRAHGLIAT